MPDADIAKNSTRFVTPATLIVSALLLTALAHFRGPEYDEAYSIFLTANHPRPAWPTGIFHPADVRHLYAGTATLIQIAHNLRAGDVHPPLYFWLLEFWRHLAGPSWFAARMLSVLCSVITLAVLARLAALADLPVLPTILIALLSYGFAYTGIIARGFALAQLLNVAGVTTLFAAERKNNWRLALAGGLALGAAGFANYLAVFSGLAAFSWLVVTFRSPRVILAAAGGFAIFLPADAYFFVAQKSSRIGQFTPFSLPHALALLAKDSAAAMFGGLPLYAGSFGGLVTAGLAVLAAAGAAAAWPRRNRASPLFALAALAPPAGLLVLGVIFHNTPIEIRYLAFGLPFVALLLASLPRPLLAVLLAVQACAIAGLAFAPATMQPQAAAAGQAARFAGRSGLILLPFGNDGVGIPGPFIHALPPTARLELLRRDTAPDLTSERHIVLARIAIDDASRASVTQFAAGLSSQPCWRAARATKLAEEFIFTCKNSFPLH